MKATEKGCLIRFAILGKVHSSVAKPAANAPDLSIRISSWNCAAESFRGTHRLDRGGAAGMRSNHKEAPARAKIVLPRAGGTLLTYESDLLGASEVLSEGEGPHTRHTGRAHPANCRSPIGLGRGAQLHPVELVEQIGRRDG